MSSSKGFRDLLAWKAACELADEVYLLTRQFPAEEKFGLVSQLRRAVVSVSSNIAEGAGYPSKADFRRFLGIAIGSTCETESLLHLSQQLGMVPSVDRGIELCANAGRLLHRLRNSLTP